MPAAATDQFLYEPDAVFVGLLLFGPRVCTACGAELPACRDYFTPDQMCEDGLKTSCRRCRRERDRRNYHARKAVTS